MQARIKKLYRKISNFAVDGIYCQPEEIFTFFFNIFIQIIQKFVIPLCVWSEVKYLKPANPETNFSNLL